MPRCEDDSDAFWLGFFVGGLVVALVILIFGVLLP